MDIAQVAPLGAPGSVFWMRASAGNPHSEQAAINPPTLEHTPCCTPSSYGARLYRAAV